MSAAATTETAATGTKIFGIRLPFDSKVLVGILFAVALLLLWLNFRGDDQPRPATSAARPVVTGGTPPSPLTTASRSSSQRLSANTRGVLRVRAVDPTGGDIDPTLRLWLLERLHDVKPTESPRNLFETAAAVPVVPAAMLNGPKMMPKAVSAVPYVPPQPQAPVTPVVNIPLRYFGYVKPESGRDSNRGFFMTTDNNVLIATEGDVLQQRFLVVTLSPNNARLEDIQLKQGQDLQFVPEALSQ